MAHVITGRLADQVRRVGREQADPQAMPFAAVLEPARVQRVIEALGGQVRACVLSPLVTFYGFLAQVISADQSCRQALAALLAWLGPTGGALPSGDDGPYCKARQRLPQGLPQQLARQVGAELQQRAGRATLLQGRPIKVVDGTTLSMPDTPANQQAYPQARTQKPGLGFPVMRLVAVFCLHCGALLQAAGGPYRGKQTGEMGLLRTLLDHFRPGDIVLGDRYFCSYWQVALLAQRGVDSLMRMHQRRRVDFRQGRRLGHDDHVVVWSKPALKPDWMEQEVYDALPRELTVREVRVRLAVPGFRVKVLVLATTLLDPQLYPATELALAFRARWHAELDLRAIKVALRMDVLRCKSPAMVQKEIWMHLLAYNLVRTVMARAAQQAQRAPRQISFTAAVQLLRSFAPTLALLEAGWVPWMDQVLLGALARQVVGDRPDRVEPRAVKRRPKPHRLLQEPRVRARKRLLRHA
jgi:hypothetical protein